jgi:GMP synthase-like glutamine amidotransferase
VPTLNGVTGPRLLIIQPAEDDAPARLGEWLAGAGADLDIVRPGNEPLPSGLDGYRGVVCLGGDMGATDDGAHPWLVDVRGLLRTAADSTVPVLAVCLGAQLLAVACGGRAAPGEAGAEVGPALVAKRDTAMTDPLFSELPLAPDVLQFHRDTIERMPANTVVLATSSRYPQAFRIGRTAYGIQFHIETTTDMVLGWTRTAADIAAVARPGDLTRERLDELHADMAEVWQPFAERFVRLASGELTPAALTRATLPLL